MEYSTQGRHVVADLWGVSFEVLNDAKALSFILQSAATIAGADILSVQEKPFEPQGATVLVLLSESHVSIHTYPEKGFAAIDCYTCGDRVDPQIAVDFLIKTLKPTKAFTKKLYRGNEEGIT